MPLARLALRPSEVAAGVECQRQVLLGRAQPHRHEVVAAAEEDAVFGRQSGRRSLLKSRVVAAAAGFLVQEGADGFDPKLVALEDFLGELLEVIRLISVEM